MEKGGTGRGVRWMIGRERSSSSRSVFSSIRSSSSSSAPYSSAGTSKSSLKSMKPTPAGRIGSVAPFFRFPLSGRGRASVFGRAAAELIPFPTFFLPNRRGTAWVVS